MNRFFGSAIVLAMFAVPAFGSPKPQTVVIPQNVTVGTTPVPAGTYKLSWAGSGSSVQATLTQGKKSIVTFSAKEVDGKNHPGIETYNRGGVSNLEIIHLDNLSLELEGAPQPGQ
jgi:hypothetical protein